MKRRGEESGVRVTTIYGCEEGGGVLSKGDVCESGVCC